MKRRTARRRLSRKRKNRRSFSRRVSRKYQRGGGANLPVPEGSVVGVDLDPKDPYSVPVLISKSVYENEVLDD
jgi:hypothetical protein